MRNLPVRAAVLIALSLPLGACSSFLGIHFARHAPRGATAPETAAAVAAPAAQAGSVTSIGRRQLADGQIGLAIESFQRALAIDEPVAPAVNGMGVAYARLGRFDLAMRYFHQAMSSDPTNPQYADNLAFLMLSPVFALRRQDDITRDVLQAAAPLDLDVPAERTANAEPAIGKLQRVSRGEVRIATAAPQSAPVASGQAIANTRSKPPLRVALGGAQPPRPQSYVRIVLPQASPARADSAVTSPSAGEAGKRR